MEGMEGEGRGEEARKGSGGEGRGGDPLLSRYTPSHYILVKAWSGEHLQRNRNSLKYEDAKTRIPVIYIFIRHDGSTDTLKTYMQTV